MACECQDIQNMINAGNKELFDLLLQMQNNEKNALIETTKTIVQAQQKINEDAFKKLSEQIEKVKKELWGGV